MKNRVFLIAAVIAAVDQAIKALIRGLPLGQEHFRILGLVRITHAVNTGAAFSVMTGHTILLAVVSVFLLAVMYLYISRHMNPTKAVYGALGCLIGGGAGNLIDRILFKGVTDYIELLLFDFPVFNLADIAITGSIVWLILLLILGRFEESTGENHG